MKTDNQHTNDDQFFKDAKVPFSKSKADVWETLSAKIDAEALTNADGVSDKEQADVAETKVVSMRFPKMAVAASVVVLIGVSMFCRLYSTDVYNGKGMQASHLLPDGSEVKLNADSKLSYHPFWWVFTRELTFEGEGFFEVEKGSNFAVHSNAGTTQVLGTSFNISTRNNGYSVYCETGRVRVSTATAKVEITPHMKAHTVGDKLVVMEALTLDDAASWVNNRFNFVDVPLHFVLDELERQYDTKVAMEDENMLQMKYSGYFVKPAKIDEALELICTTFGLTFEDDSEGHYILK